MNRLRLQFARAGGRAVSLLAAGLLALPAVACRYNVRDLGFLDLETEGYRLVVALGTNVASAASQTWRDDLARRLRDTNVRPEFAPAGPLPEGFGTNQPPAALLVSPDGPGFAIAWNAAPSGADANALSRIESLVDSPVRRALRETTSRRFGAILLIEGTDAAQNQVAREAIESAIKEVGGTLATLPKKIAEAPALVTLAPPAFAQEAVLLWALRLDQAPVAEPRVAAFYGKARWIGPLMKGAEITAANLSRLFGVVGADCECGMDLSWTRGTSLPLRWDVATHQAAVKTLGFDPNDPLVQAEAGRIIDRYTSGAPAKIRVSEAAEIPSVPAKTIMTPGPVAAASPAMFANLRLLLGVLAIGVVGACGWLWWRASRR